MKKRPFQFLLLLVLLLCLAACAIVTETTPPASPMPTVIPTAEPTPSSAPFAGLDPAAEPPLTEAERAAPAPEFLDEALQMLYRRMHSICDLFDGTAEYFDSYWPMAEGQTQAEPMPRFTEDGGAENGWYYEVARGRYAVWSDFDAMVHSLMTDRLFQELNSATVSPLFREYLGRTAYLPTSKTSGDDGRNPFFPDTFELIEETEDSICFYVVGYYSYDGDMRDDETPEAWAQRVGQRYDEVRKFEIELVKTEDGWRFDRFALTSH